MVLCTNCIKEGAEACMHDVRRMEGLEMDLCEQQHMHQRQRWVQMSEDERRERREQQRLWYRRRRSQMTDQEIAFQNERRRLRYRLRRLRANAEQTNGAMCGNPMPDVQEGSAQANGHKALEKAEENEQGEQQRNYEWSVWMNSQQIEPQEQQRLEYGQQTRQVSGEQVRENGGRQKQWRWKVEARKGSADTEAQPADLNVMVRVATGAVVEQSDDSETTETDESVQGMLSGKHCGDVARANRAPDVDRLSSTDEVTSKARSFEGTAQMHQPDACQAGYLSKSVRLTEIKRLARAMHSLSTS